MKSSFFLIFHVLFIVVAASPSFAASVYFIDAKPQQVIKVELADTMAKAERGLMFRNDLPEGRGMWFIFNDNAERVFWMKNVRFPLDILFIDKKYVIRKIQRMVPPCFREPCPRYYSDGPARYVLEVRGGYCDKKGVKEGQRVEYLP